MTLPFTLKFFKKIELFQDLQILNGVFERAVRRRDEVHETKSTWEVEKKVLYWSWWGHMHLGSPLVVRRFQNEEDLKDLKITRKEAEVAGIREFMRNLVERGFARYESPNEKESSGIILTRKGRLMGEVIYEVYRLKRIEQEPFWRIYEEVYGADHYLKETWKFWLYKAIVWIGWGIILALIFNLTYEVIIKF